MVKSLIFGATLGLFTILSGSLYADSFKATCPTVYNVGGGGCGDSYYARPVTLSGSEIGVLYQLQMNGVNYGASVAGTGDPLQWNNLPSGTYTVYTVVASGGNCSQPMNGSASTSNYLEGANWALAFDLGGGAMDYHDTRTIGPSHCYGADFGTGGDDIYYQVSNTETIELTVSHCGSAFNTIIYVIDDANYIVASKTIDASTNCQEQNVLRCTLTPGMYYIVSKAASLSAQGNLVTKITQRCAVYKDSDPEAGGYAISPSTSTIYEGQAAVLTAPVNMSVSEWVSSSGNSIEFVSGDKHEIRVRPGETTTYTVRGTVSQCQILLLQATVNVLADDSPHNFVKETTLQVAAIRNTEDLATIGAGQKTVTANYFDGLGRLSQTVSWQASPSGRDIVQPVIYDPYGRQQKVYLPYVTTTRNGHFKTDPVGQTSTYTTSAQYGFYQTDNDGVVNEAKPYSETVFEASPLNRVLKQGAPGTTWQPDGNLTNSTDRTIKHDYQSNAANEVLLFAYDPLTASVTATDFYDANQLHANKTKDEHNNEVIEYVDKDGRTILKKVQYGVDADSKALYACTYYIYDDFGNLVVVLPPEAINSALSALTQP